MDYDPTGWFAEWDEKRRAWYPTVQLAGSLMASFNDLSFPTRGDCLAFIRDNLSSLGRMNPGSVQGSQPR